MRSGLVQKRSFIFYYLRFADIKITRFNHTNTHKLNNVTMKVKTNKKLLAPITLTGSKTMYGTKRKERKRLLDTTRYLVSLKVKDFNKKLQKL